MSKLEKKYIEQVVTQYPQLRKKLFARGFFLTNDFVKEDQYPFYNAWKGLKIGNYRLYVSEEQAYYVEQYKDKYFVLIGHAYNPFTMCSDEKKILQTLTAYKDLDEEFFSKINELTGIFTLIIFEGEKICIIGDPTCMQTTFYTKIKHNIYVASHTNLLADLLELQWDPYVKEMSEYRFFPLLGNALPGDLTQYKEIKRLVPNHYVILDKKDILVQRFYWPHSLKLKEEDIVKKSETIIHNNLELIAKKWRKPAISMTGGCDSKTTLACATGIYDKFSYFSYKSSESEEVDAKAAREICKRLGLKHKVYTISENDSDYENIEAVRAILEWNTGGIVPINRNDVRKRAFFSNIDDFDIEVKSWASEIGRAYYSKRFAGRKKFGKKPTPRKCTTLYKFFLNNRKLVRETDKVFKEYLDKYFEQAKKDAIEWQEQFFWEYRVPSWNGLVITEEHRYSFDITIPYNNRKLLAILLSAPLESRLDDDIYKKIRKSMNPEIDAVGISITNLKHTKNRGIAENIYYTIHSKILF